MKGLFYNKNFTWMFVGRVITNIGDSLYAVAAMWLVYELGGSTFYTGLAGFLTLFPRLIQFLSGPLIDRLPVRPILIVTQLIQCALLLVIPVAYYFGFLSVFLVLLITPILTTLNMFVYPAQVAALPKFVPEKDLSKANSMFTVAYQGIEIVCNAIAGVLIVIIGAVAIYLLDAVMFLIGAFIFSMIRMPKQEKVVEKVTEDVQSTTEMNQQVTVRQSMKKYIKTYMQDLKEGTAILLGSKFTRLLIGAIAINLVGGATFVVLPAFSNHLGGAEFYGLLLMAAAVGSLTGALAAPYLKLERYGIGKVYAGAFLISGAAWSLSVFSPWTWLVIVIYGLAWFPGGVTNILIQTVLQKGVPKHLLGRVISASFSISGIALPLGAMAGGILGVWIGSVYVIAVSGLVVIVVGVFWLIDKTSRMLPSCNEVDEHTFAIKNDNASVIKESVEMA